MGTFLLQDETVKSDNLVERPFFLETLASSQKSHIGITKNILNISRTLGAVSFTYFIAPAVSSPQIDIPRLLFSNAWSDRASKMDIELKHLIETVYEIMIAEGTPTNLLSLVQGEKAIDPSLALKIAKKATAAGIVDEYLIPVYGPFKIEGCMCFGLKSAVPSLQPEVRYTLETLASVSHTKIVSSFRDQIKKVALSNRELEVLQWLALGKSQNDIAVILNVKRATIDSYNRRIYQKLGVNTKIAAVLAGISAGVVNL